MADVQQGPSLPDTKSASYVHAALLRRGVFLALIPLIVVSVGVALMLRLRSTPAGPRAHLSIPLPSGQQLTGPPAISPDGQIVAWTSRTGTGRAFLYVRPLNDPEPKAISGSEDAFLPFFSPDGEWVAFFARGRLMKAAVSGGSVTAIARRSRPLGRHLGERRIYRLYSGIQLRPSPGFRKWGRAEALTKPDGGRADTDTSLWFIGKPARGPHNSM